jgi:hypothetical protein
MAIGWGLVRRTRGLTRLPKKEMSLTRAMSQHSRRAARSPRDVLVAAATARGCWVLDMLFYLFTII